MKSFKIAVCQLHVVDDKEINLQRAVALIEESASNGADLVVLPEMFNCPYSNDKFPEYAEDRDKINVAKDFLDRAGFKPTDKVEHSGNMEINNPLKVLTTEELKKLIQDDK